MVNAYLDPASGSMLLGAIFLAVVAVVVLVVVLVARAAGGSRRQDPPGETCSGCGAVRTGQPYCANCGEPQPVA